MIQNIATWGTLAGTVATALATFFLWRVTRLLAGETKRMADAAARPMVVANIVPNQWSTIHFDIEIENTGNATAFEIEVTFDPPLLRKANERDIPAPFQRISLLKPGQQLKSYLGDVAGYLNQAFQVTVKWKLYPRSSAEERLEYRVNMAEWNGVRYLGSRNLLVQIAEQLKHIREDWRSVASGSRRIEADVYDSDDRDEEDRILKERFGRSAEAASDQ